MTKADTLMRVTDILARVRDLVAFLPYMPPQNHAVGEEIDQITADLLRLEANVAIVVNEFMANRYRMYNATAHNVTNADGLSGRWQQWRQRAS